MLWDEVSSYAADPTPQKPLTLADIEEAVARVVPLQPYRWMIRRAGLSAEQDALLDRLGLPELTGKDFRPRRSESLPDGVVALIVTEHGGRNGDPLADGVTIAMVTG